MVSRMREMWPTGNDDQADLLNLVQRSRLSMVTLYKFLLTKIKIKTSLYSSSYKAMT